MNPAISAAPPRDYLAYLQTAMWRTKRNHALRRAEYRCERCGAKHALEVHHLTYERLGREWDQDLEVLCHACHRAETIVTMAHSESALYLKLVRDIHRHPDFPTDPDAQLDLMQTICASLKIDYRTEPIVKALRLVLGEVSIPLRLKPAWTGPLPPPRPLTRREADDLIAELLGDQQIRTMKKAEDARAHEARVRAQAAAMRGQRRGRRPIQERLEAIFSGDENEDLRRLDHELAEIAEMRDRE